MQFRRVIVVFLSASVFAACGGDDEGARTAAAVATPTSEAPTPPPPTSTAAAPTPTAAAPTPTPTPSPAAAESTPAPKKKKAPRGPDDATHGSLTLTATDFAFSSKTVEARPGNLEVTLENVGGTAHDVVFAPEGGSKPAAALPLTEPGNRVEQTIRLRAGRYDFYCSVPGHAERGMRGRLRVS